MFFQVAALPRFPPRPKDQNCRFCLPTKNDHGSTETQKGPFCLMKQTVFIQGRMATIASKLKSFGFARYNSCFSPNGNGHASNDTQKCSDGVHSERNDHSSIETQMCWLCLLELMALGVVMVASELKSVGFA